MGAQEGGTLPSGLLYVPAEGIEVGVGETLKVGPATKVYGIGQLRVWGNLTVKGDPASTANFTVPIVVFPGGRVDMEDAHVWTINTTAIQARSATLRLSRVLFDGNNRALLASGSSDVVVSDSVFRDHAGEAVYVEEEADVTLERVEFSGNGRGVTVYSASRFLLNGSSFRDNGQHLVIDLGPWSTSGDFMLSNDSFGPPSPTAAQLPGILLRHDPPLVEEASQRVVRLDSNRIEGAVVGLRAEGRGLIVQSRNDSFVDNDIGVSVQLATVSVIGGTFANDRDVAGSGRVTLDGVTYLRPDALAITPSAGTRWVPWAVVGVVVLLGVLTFVAMKLRRRVSAPSFGLHIESAAPASVAPTPPAIRPEEGAALTAVERRILDDILAHPGTPQRAVADRLGTTRQALHYHVKKLEARGLVHKAIEGRETRCTVPDAARAHLGRESMRTDSHEKA